MFVNKIELNYYQCMLIFISSKNDN